MPVQYYVSTEVKAFSSRLHFHIRAQRLPFQATSFFFLTNRRDVNFNEKNSDDFSKIKG